MVDLLQLLKPLSHHSVDAALAGALPTAGSEDAKRIATMLLGRERSDFSGSLIEHYHRLPQHARERVVARAWTLQTALRNSGRKTHSQAAANAVEVIGKAGLASMAYLATALVRNADRPRQEVAANCLLRLARQRGPRCEAQAQRSIDEDNPQSSASVETASTGPNEVMSVSSGDTLAVAAAVREAVVHYHQHELPQVLRALLVLLPVMPRALNDLTDLFADPNHAAVKPLRQMLEAADTPEPRQALLPALRLKALADSAEHGLRQAAGNGHLDQALEHHQVLGLPGIRPALQPMANPAQLCPAAKDVQSWSQTQQQGLVRWLANLPLGRDGHIEQLAGLSESLRGRPRMTAVRRLIELSQDHTNEHLADSRPRVGDISQSAWASTSVEPSLDNAPGQGEDTTVDPARAALARYAAATNSEPASALAAVEALQAVQYPSLPTVLSQMLQASGDQVRQMAAQRLAPGVFEKLWRHWHRMDNSQRQALGQAWLKLDPDSHQRLRDKLDLGDRRPVLRALEIIRTLEQQPALEPRITLLTHSADPSIAAAASRTWARNEPPRVPGTIRRQAVPTPTAPSQAVSSVVGVGGMWAVGQVVLTLAQTYDKQPLQAKRPGPDGGEEGRITRVTPKAVSRSVQEGVGWTDPGPMILALTLVLLGLGLIQVVRSWRINRMHDRGPTSLGLFHKASAAAGVSWADQWLLLRVSRHSGLPTPLTLLISRRTLLTHGRNYAHHQRLHRPGHIQKRIRRLAQSVFSPQ